MNTPIPQQLRIPAFLEVSTFLKQDPQLLEQMAIYDEWTKLKDILKKSTDKKKRDDNDFFACLDFSAFLKHTKLIMQLNAHKDEILKTYEEDARRFRASRELEANGEQVAAKPPLAPELAQATELLSKAFKYEAELQSVISSFKILQQKVNNWETLQWRPTVAAAGRQTAEAIAAQVSINLTQNSAYQSLISAAENHPHKAELHDALQENLQNFEVSLAEQLGNRASKTECARIVNHVPETPRDAFYEMNGTLIAAGNETTFYRMLKNIFKQFNFNETHSELYEQIEPVRLAVQHINDAKSKDFLGIYSRILDTENANYTTGLKDLSTLGAQGEDLRSKLFDIMEELAQLSKYKKPYAPSFQSGLY